MVVGHQTKQLGTVQAAEVAVPFFGFVHQLSTVKHMFVLQLPSRPSGTDMAGKAIDGGVKLHIRRFADFAHIVQKSGGGLQMGAKMRCCDWWRIHMTSHVTRPNPKLVALPRCKSGTAWSQGPERPQGPRITIFPSNPYRLILRPCRAE